MRWLQRKSEPTNGSESKPRPHWFSGSALREAVARGGCPVCVSVALSDRRAVHAFLYEGMMSPYGRGDFLDGCGFCSQHFWMAKKIEEECWPEGGIGMAILCEDSIRFAIDAIEDKKHHRKHMARKVPSFEPGSSCTFCRENQRKEAALVEVLEELTEDREFAETVNQGRLCLRHTELALTHWSLPEKKKWLSDILHRHADELRNELRELIRKHDYQFRGEPKGCEQESVRRTAEFLFGTPYSSKKALP